MLDRKFTRISAERKDSACGFMGPIAKREEGERSVHQGRRPTLAAAMTRSAEKNPRKIGA